MKILLVFDKTTEQKLSQHNYWEEAWDVPTWHPTFDDATQVALLLNKPTDLIEPLTGKHIYPADYLTPITYDYIYKTHVPMVSQGGIMLAPESLVATPGNTTISLSWTHMPDPFDKIIIRRALGPTAPDGVDVEVGGLEDPGKPSSYIDAGLTNGQQYSYSVFVVDAYSASPPASVSVTPMA